MYFGIKEYNTNYELSKERVKNELLTNEITKWRDSVNRSMAKIKVIQTDINVLNNVYKSNLDSITKKFNILEKEYKNINSIFTTKSDTKDSIVVKIVDNKFKFSDKWTNISGFLDSEGKLNFNYAINNEYTYLTYFDQKRLFNFIPYGKRSLYIQAISENPNTTINDLKKIDITPQKRKFMVNLGPQFGYGITRFGTTLYAGIGLNVKFNTY